MPPKWGCFSVAALRVRGGVSSRKRLCGDERSRCHRFRSRGAEFGVLNNLFTIA
jgi:hypothetical protein